MKSCEEGRLCAALSLSVVAVTITRRLHGHLWPILQTAVAATVAWCLASLVLPDGRPAFASIAAVICLGASHGQRGSKALQLVAGVVLGITVASALVAIFGSGVWQIGVLVAMAMATATLLGGGELLTGEAAVSAILIVSLDPSSSPHFTANRILEGVIGGAVALAISSLLFPADPRLAVNRAAQAAFSGLGGALERLASALAASDATAAAEALDEARALDLGPFQEALEVGRESARLSPRAGAPRSTSSNAMARASPRSTTRSATPASSRATRCARCAPARPCPRTCPRRSASSPAPSGRLAASFDSPDEAISSHAHALRAASLAPDATPEVAGQVRSIAVDLRRATDRVDISVSDVEAPTEELLVAV